MHGLVCNNEEGDEVNASTTVEVAIMATSSAADTVTATAMAVGILAIGPDILLFTMVGDSAAILK